MMKLQEAKQKADELVAMMQPFLERCEIAGSIMREKDECNDIEIVVVPKWELQDNPLDLFGGQVAVNLLHEFLIHSDIRWIYKRNGETFPAMPQPTAKMMKGVLPGGAQLDLFLATPDNFGLIKMIRIGSADFSHAMVERARQIGKPSRDGFLHVRGEQIATPEERDVFRALGVEWIEPRERTGADAMKIIGFGVSE